MNYCPWIFTTHNGYVFLPKVNTMGSGGRTSLVGKRLVVTMVVERNKAAARMQYSETGEEKMVKTKTNATTSSEKEEKDLIIGCSEGLLLPVFW